MCPLSIKQRMPKTNAALTATRFSACVPHSNSLLGNMLGNRKTDSSVLRQQGWHLLICYRLYLEYPVNGFIWTETRYLLFPVSASREILDEFQGKMHKHQRLKQKQAPVMERWMLPHMCLPSLRHISHLFSWITAVPRKSNEFKAPSRPRQQVSQALSLHRSHFPSVRLDHN